MPERKGLVSACIMSGYGFGGFIFGIIINLLFNPDNLDFEYDQNCQDLINECLKFLPQTVGDRLPFVFVTLVFIYSSLIILGCLMI